MGEWTCAGRLSGRDVEDYDDFRVHIVSGGLSQAAIGGMIGGAIAILIGLVLIAVLTYRRRYRSVSQTPGNGTPPSPTL